MRLLGIFFRLSLCLGFLFCEVIDNVLTWGYPKVYYFAVKGDRVYEKNSFIDLFFHGPDSYWLF